MIGIYKITNTINQKCYIGQSRNIEKRWKEHKYLAFQPTNNKYNYPLYAAFRKYGLDSFTFEILEECQLNNLNGREVYWINYYKPQYNQTAGGNFSIVPQKLTEKQVEEIQNILLADKKGIVSHKELAIAYGVHKDTIRDINVGRTWFNPKYDYPLHLSKFDPSTKKLHYCIDCGKQISKKATRCIQCASKLNQKELPVTREELKALIRTTPFTTIGKMYGITDNAIRKWCDKYGLPRKVGEIKQYSDQEWQNV